MLAVCAATLCGTLLYAGDVWRDKPYTQWAQKDVQKILTDSPWIKTVHVSAGWRSGDRSNAAYDTSTTASNNAGGPSGPAGGPTNSNSGSAAQNAALLASAKDTEASYTVSWFSARTVRQALARQQVLSGAMTEPDADKALAQDFEEFAITVAGRDMTPFFKASETDLAANSFLLLKQDKKKIPASRVVFQRPAAVTTNALPPVTAVVFYFPRKAVSGEPSIPPQEKSAEFSCSCGGANIKTSFDLQKMVAAQGPDW
jgi:hypothetical protein